jgi:hypothetical protein
MAASAAGESPRFGVFKNSLTNAGIVSRGSDADPWVNAERRAHSDSAQPRPTGVDFPAIVELQLPIRPLRAISVFEGHPKEVALFISSPPHARSGPLFN